jgi:hypothetical protein
MADRLRPTKRHLDRLRGALRDLDERERRLQERFGNRVKGSSRSADYLMAEALRAVLAYVDYDDEWTDYTRTTKPDTQSGRLAWRVKPTDGVAMPGKDQP